jgi:1-acyl-sn-glycerol-3-phosphate acyltransferase
VRDAAPLLPGRRAGQQCAGRGKKAGLRRLTADLHDRDPDYLREMPPLLWLISTFYFRGEVRSLGNIPRDEACALVGNHRAAT